MGDGAVKERVWTKWSDKRAPNERGTFRYRVTADILGATLSLEWSEKMTLCGMGYHENEWWPVTLCHWDGYNRRITHNGLEWSHPREDDSPEVTWHGLDLLPCPFSGKPPQIKAEGRYIGAPLWHSEALWISSGFIKPMRFTSAKELIRIWNTRAPDAATLARAERAEALLARAYELGRDDAAKAVYEAGRMTHGHLAAIGSIVPPDDLAARLEAKP